MGGTGTGAWKQVLLLIAGMIVLAGCSSIVIDRSVPEKEVRPLVHPTIGFDEMVRGEFQAAIQKNLDLLKESRENTTLAEIYFNLGLLHAHPGNPGRNLEKAKRYFQLVITESPDNPLAGEARIWVGILKLIEETKQVDIDIEKKKELLK